MTEIREDWDIDENGKRFSWRYEYSSKNGLLKREISTIGTEYKQIQYYQYDLQGRLKHIFSYSFDRISFLVIQAKHQQETAICTLCVLYKKYIEFCLVKQFSRVISFGIIIMQGIKAKIRIKEKI